MSQMRKYRPFVERAAKGPNRPFAAFKFVPMKGRNARKADASKEFLSAFTQLHGHKIGITVS
jgi:hypothetical protein